MNGTIKVMVFERKDKPGRFMCSNHHEWPSDDDEYGDVELKDIERAYVVTNKDTENADGNTFDNWYSDMKKYDEIVKKKFGPDAINSLEPDAILEFYDHKLIDIPTEKMEAVIDINEKGYESEYLKEYYKK